MPDSTSALINQLMNPPNPMERIGQTVSSANALLQLQADQAAADAYRQSIDPVTGAFDQGKFNALASQAPGGSFNFGRQMQSAGQGLQAQGLGTQADLQARLNTQQAAQAYLTPLYQRILNNGTVTGNDIVKELENVPPGVLPAPMLKSFRDKATAIGDGNANGLVLGGYYATQHGIEMMNAAGPGATSYPTGGTTTVIPMNPRYPGASPLATGGGQLTHTPSADTMADIVDVRLSDGTTQQMVRGDAQAAVGSEVRSGVTILPPPAGGWATVRSAAPSATQPTPQRTTPAPTRTAPAPVPPAPTTQPPVTTTPPVTRQPPVGQTAPGGATYGRTPSPGEVATTEESAAQYREARANQTGAQQRLLTIQQAQRALATAMTGNKTQLLQTVNSVLGTYAPELIRKIIPGYDPEKAATDYDLAQKYLQQIVNSTQVGGGPTTNDKLSAATTANPNVHIMNKAAVEVLGNLAAAEQMGQYLWSQAQAQGVTPQNFAEWKAKWMQTHDPRAFLPRDKASLDYLRKNLNPRERKVLSDTMEELDRNGVIPLDPRQPPAQD